MSAARGLFLAVMLLVALLQVQASRLTEENIVGFTKSVSFQTFGDGLSTFYTYRSNLVSVNGAALGVEEGFGETLPVGDRVLYVFQETFPDGAFTVKGILNNPTTNTTYDVYAITGGTGKYYGATGQYSSKEVDENTYAVTIDVVY